MWLLAPSHACLMSSIDGVPNSSVINSNCQWKICLRIVEQSESLLLSHLLNGTLCLEQNATAQELAENATNRPNINRGRVMSRTHQDFRCSIVLRNHFLSHVFWLVRFLDACQAEIANLQHAIAVHEQVARLDVAMQNACWVQILETTKNLIEKHFDVISR